MLLLELVVCGSLVYWFFFLLLCFVFWCDVGFIGIVDILLLVVIVDVL